MQAHTRRADERRHRSVEARDESGELLSPLPHLPPVELRPIGQRAGEVAADHWVEEGAAAGVQRPMRTHREDRRSLSSVRPR